MDSQPYQYEPLSHDVPQIRLLEILRDAPGQLLSLRLTHTDLAASPPYQALSYTWQSPFMLGNDPRQEALNAQSPVSARLLLNGQPFEVTEHLHDALEFLAQRPPPATPFLWIDALCIHQGDLNERAQQVRLMGRVFSQAELVIAWLGPASADSGRAIDFLSELAAHATRPDRVAWLVGLARDPAQLSTWQAFAALITRGWWKRSWVIQEYVLGAEVSFAVGDRMLKGSEMDAATQLLFDGWAACFATGTLQKVGLNARVIDPLWNLFELRHRLKQGGAAAAARIGPLTYLSRTRQSRASDPRDRLFAKFGMIGERASALCAPDYKISPRTIYRTFFRRYVDKHGDLYIVCHSGLGFSPENPPSPTWLPTWSPTKHPYALRCCWSGKKEDWPRYRAAGDSRAMIEICGEGDYALRCKALDVDAVDGIQFEPWWCGEGMVKEGYQSRSGKNAYGSIKATYHALRRTLVADTNRRVGRLKFPMFEPAQSPAIFGLLFARACQGYDELLEALEETPGEIPAASRVGASNIEKRWHGMRHLRLGDTLLRDAVNQALQSDWARKDVPPEVIDDILRAPFSPRVEWSSFEHSHGQASYRRRVFTTQQGYLGMATRALQQGDRVVILAGCPVPVLLRPKGSQYQLVGEAYVDGMMNGELAGQDAAEWPTVELC